MSAERFLGQMPASDRHLAGLPDEDRPALDHVARIALDHFRVPVAFVALLDAPEPWVAGAREMMFACRNRSESFCAYAIRSGNLLVVDDTLRDPRFRDKEYVAGSPYVRFYAGAPMILDGDRRLGTVCILDRVPRTLDVGQRIVLRNLAGIAVSEMRLLESRKAAA